MPTLKSLTIDVPGIEEADWRFILGFSTLDRLRIDVGDWRTEGWDEPFHVGKLPNLRHLSSKAPLYNITRHLLPALVNSPLETLDLHMLQSREHHVSSVSINPFGPFKSTLRHLRLTQTEMPMKSDSKGFSRAAQVLKGQRKDIRCEKLYARNMWWRNYHSRLAGEGPLKALEEASNFLSLLVGELKTTRDYSEAACVLPYLDKLRGLMHFEGFMSSPGILRLSTPVGLSASNDTSENMSHRMF